MNFNEAYKNITNNFDIAKMYKDEILVLSSLVNLRYVKHTVEIKIFLRALWEAYLNTADKGTIYSKFDYKDHKLRYIGECGIFSNEIIFKFYSIRGTVYTVGVVYNTDGTKIQIYDGGERKGYEASED